jgi:hypothetical protein
MPGLDLGVATSGVELGDMLQVRGATRRWEWLNLFVACRSDDVTVAVRMVDAEPTRYRIVRDGETVYGNYA